MVYDPGETSRQWVRDHPEEARENGRRARAIMLKRRANGGFHAPYPTDGTYEERLAWYEREFLDLATRHTPPRKREEWLKMAFMCVTKRGPGKATDDPMSQYAEELKRQIAHRESDNGQES
jgi:hypothetical protein